MVDSNRSIVVLILRWAEVGRVFLSGVHLVPHLLVPETACGVSTFESDTPSGGEEKKEKKKEKEKSEKKSRVQGKSAAKNSKLYTFIEFMTILFITISDDS